jgi:hypothetical protein
MAESKIKNNCLPMALARNKVVPFINVESEKRPCGETTETLALANFLLK